MPTIRRSRTMPVATIGGGVSAVPASLVVTPATVEIEEPLTQQLTAVVSDAGGTPITVQKAAGASVFSPIAVEYESDDELIATVDSAGLITAVAEGTCVITATITGTAITDTVAVEVTAA